MREVTAYQCDSCGKVLKHRSSAVRHEKNCKHNPAVMACTTCCHHSIERHDCSGWNEPPNENVVPVCSSQKAAEDEEFYFVHNENPFYILRYCQHWEHKNDTTN